MTPAEKHATAFLAALGYDDTALTAPRYATVRQAILTAVEAAMAEGAGWQPIETAPFNTPVRVKVGEMTFVARLVPGAAMNSAEESCDQWQAEYEGQHPECWTDGACWESNANEVMSLQPAAWQPLPAPPTTAEETTK